MPQHRYPLNALTQMFEKACLSNIFGDPDRDINNRKNIPVHIRPMQDPRVSYIKIEAAPNVGDPTILSSEQFVVIVHTRPSEPTCALIFFGDHFDRAQFENLAKLLEGQADILSHIDDDENEYKIFVTNPTQEKIDTIVRAWRTAIEPSLKDLGWDISP